MLTRRLSKVSPMTGKTDAGPDEEDDEDDWQPEET